MNMKKIVPSLLISLTLFALSAFFYSIFWWSDIAISKQVGITFLILGSTHFLFRVLVYVTLVQHITSNRVRYNLSKILNLLHLFVAVLFILRVWLPDSNTLLAAYGFVAAAAAFSVQDLFKNFIGGIIIVVKGLYSIGDRIQVGETHGDVIDIGILYTSLLEMRGWVAGDQSTGRIVRVPNGKVLNLDITNYTADHSFIWDEVHIPVTHESDWKLAESILHEIVVEATSELSVSAIEEIRHLQSKYFLTNNNVEPRVYMAITDNWISLYARYIVSARERRNVQDRIMRQIKEKFDAKNNITIASNTSTITIVK
jgi:small-conductance mechanosensitive channel